MALREFVPSEVLDCVEEMDLSFLTGSPGTLRALVEEQDSNPRDLDSLKAIVTMGAQLEKKVCERCMEVLTPNIFNGYGISEAFWNTFLRPYNLPEGVGSAGYSCKDDEVRVVKIPELGLRAKPNEVVPQNNEEQGEVIVRAPHKCAYDYIGSPEEAERAFYKGWMYTGDIATWDEDRIIIIMGRKDNIFISGGENIHPVQVEEVINEHPKVEDSIVVGTPHDKWGRAVKAYVVKKDPSLEINELEEHCKNHPTLARYKRPRYYKFLEELPMTATGKKKHYEIQKRVEEDMKEN